MNQSISSPHFAHRVASILAISALALGLAACNKAEEPTVGKKLDSAVEKTEQAAAEARAKAESALQKAETKVEEGAVKAESAVKQAASAAMGTIDDATITAQISAGLAKDPGLSALKIDVDTRAGAVTLKGPVATLAAKDRAELIAKETKGVTRVDNQLAVANR